MCCAGRGTGWLLRLVVVDFREFGVDHVVLGRFGTGVAFNVANLSLLAMLVLRQHMINKERAMA